MKAPDYIKLSGTGDVISVSFGKKRTRETKYTQTVNEYGHIELERILNTLKTKKSMFCNPNNVFVTDSGKTSCKFLFGKPQCEENLCCKICEHRKFRTCLNRCDKTKGEKYNLKKENVTRKLWKDALEKAEKEQIILKTEEKAFELVNREKNLVDLRKLMAADCKHVNICRSVKGNNVCGHVSGNPCEETKCCRFCPASETCNSCCRFIVVGSDKEVSLIHGDIFNVMEKVPGTIYGKVNKLVYGPNSKIKTREEALNLIQELENKEQNIKKVKVKTNPAVVMRTVDECVKNKICPGCEWNTTKFRLYPHDANDNGRVLCRKDWLAAGYPEPVSGHNWYKKGVDGIWIETHVANKK